MALTYITDLSHVLDEGGELPDLHPRALTLTLHLLSIVEWMTAMGAAPEEDELTNVVCWRRPGRKPCIGQIVAFFDSEMDVIIWGCPVCNNNGEISGWRDTMWDRSGPIL